MHLIPLTLNSYQSFQVKVYGNILPVKECQRERLKSYAMKNSSDTPKLTCEAWVQQSMYMIGKLPKQRCGKEVVGKDVHDRNLCNKHLKRWQKKIAKQKAIITATQFIQKPPIQHTEANNYLLGFSCVELAENFLND